MYFVEFDLYNSYNFDTDLYLLKFEQTNGHTQRSGHWLKHINAFICAFKNANAKNFRSRFVPG